MRRRRGESFRMQFWRWYLAACVGAQLVCAVLVGLGVVAGEPALSGREFWLFYALWVLGVAVLLVPGMWLYVLVWQVSVDRERLWASDMWGLFVSASWSSIRDARPFTLAGVLPYLRVFSSETRRVIWLPLFLVGYDRFAALVARYAGEGHPLTRELRRRATPSAERLP